MVRYIRAGLILLACLFCVGRASAAGGSCPSGANYLNASTGAQVTLSSLGVTSCFYISAGGSDSNSGTSESTPWLHAPGMPNCASNCRTAWSGTLSAGTGIILRGGDTWHFGISTDSAGSPASGGTWDFNASPYPSGSSSNPIYIGVDQTWYSGGAWSRPIFNADNPLCNATNAGTGGCSSGSYPGGLFYVSSCAHQIPGGSNDFFEMGGNIGYFIVDNIEMTGLCQSQVGQPAHTNDFFSYGGIGHPDTFENIYIHGWTHLRFAAANGFSGCTSSVVCFGMWAFEGGALSNPGETIKNVVVDGSDSDGIGLGVGYCGCYDISDSVFNYTSQLIPNDLHDFHDNLYENFFENGHSNLIEDSETSPIGTIYNNVFRHVEVTGGSGGVFLWPGPTSSGDSSYVFNNIAYDVGNVEYLNMGGLGVTTNSGSYKVFNNTFQVNASQSILNCGSPQGSVADTNNLMIDDGGYINGSCVTTTSVKTMANATAILDGYTSVEAYAYAPTSIGSPTVGTGTNEYSGYCSTLKASSDILIQAAGAACQSDTGYACSYNLANHSVTCPARIPVGRPSSGAWDSGAYQYAAAQGQPQPAANANTTVR